MANPERFDALVLGGGEGGKYLAWHLARSGRRVAVIERRLVGGSCPNTNCLPSKNEIWSAKVADLARHGGTFGARTGPVAVDMAQVRQRKRDMVAGLEASANRDWEWEDAIMQGHALFHRLRSVQRGTVQVDLKTRTVSLLAD